MRAMAVRMRRLASRTRFRKKYVSRIMNGRGERVARARMRCHLNSTAAIANSSTKSFNMATTPGCEEIVERVHVGGGARHQPPDRAAIEETHGQPLQMFEDFLAQVVHGFLSDPLHDADLHILQAKARENRAGISEDYPKQAQQRGAFGPIVPS